MSLKDHQKKVPPYVVKKRENKRKMVSTKPKIKFSTEINNKVKLTPPPKNGKALVKDQHKGKLVYPNTLALPSGVRNVKCEGGVQKKCKSPRRFSIYRGELTDAIAKREFSFADLLYNHLRDYYTSFTEDEVDIRIVIAMARGKVLRKKLNLFMSKRHPIHFGLYSDLIYEELSHFYAVIREKEEHINLMIAVARGKVYQLSKQKKVLVPTLKSTCEQRFSISYTYKKKDRSPRKSTKGVQSPNL